MLPVRSIAFAALAAISVPTAASTAERVGQAVLIKTAVTGANGPLAVREPVHRDERIRTSASGLGQFVFRDGTKLAVGWGSSVVIDKYVFDDERSVAKLTIKATKGTFRWISGNSKSSAYEIVTPAGTIGVRGTAFDFFVGANGQTAVVLLNGSARFCNGAGCQELRRRCDCVVASPGSRPSSAQRVSRNTLRTLGTQRALPFLSGNQELARGFGVTGCGLASASTLGNGQGSVRERSAPAPSKRLLRRLPHRKLRPRRLPRLRTGHKPRRRTRRALQRPIQILPASLTNLISPTSQTSRANPVITMAIIMANPESPTIGTTTIRTGAARTGVDRRETGEDATGDRAAVASAARA